MRRFLTLDQVEVDEESGIISISMQDETLYPTLSMRREGAYITISASYGPLEIALRPHFEELSRLLSRLQPIAGLQTTRQVGTSQAYLAIGLRTDGTLVLRPTIVGDATGHISFNLALSDEVRQAFFAWLPVDTSS